jgi:hypothetical protein
MRRFSISLYILLSCFFGLVLPSWADPPPPSSITVPTNTAATQYMQNYTYSVQSSYCGMTGGDTIGSFKLFLIDDGGSPTLQDDGKSGVTISFDSSNGCANWVSGLGVAFKAGAAFADATIFNAFWIAFGAMMAIFTGLVLVWAGRAVAGATFMYRAALIILFLPSYAWAFIRIHNTMIYLNNSLIGTIVNPIFNTNQWNAGNWVDAMANAITDVTVAIVGIPVEWIIDMAHKLYVAGLNILVVILFIWGVIAIMGTIFSGLGTELFKAWAKTTLLTYLTYFLWNLAAALGMVLMRSNAQGNISIYWATEASFILIPGIMAAIASGGNAASSIPAFAQGTMNNAMATAQMGIGIAEAFAGNPSGLMKGVQSATGTAVGGAGSGNIGSGGGGGGGGGGGASALADSQSHNDSSSLRRGGGRNSASAGEYAEYTPVGSSGGNSSGGSSSSGSSGGSGGAIITPPPANSNASLVRTGSGELATTSNGSGGAIVHQAASNGSGGSAGIPAEAYSVQQNNLRNVVSGLVSAALRSAGMEAHTQGAHTAGAVLVGNADTVGSLVRQGLPEESKRPLDAKLYPADGFNTGW